MAGEQIKLHLGCGVVYRPGYVNIDSNDASVADLLADAGFLPYDPGTIALIEANHLIEHFDHAHVRYLLASWYRLLEPGGKLIIETPDLNTTFSEFLKAKGDRKRTLLQWIYGVESKGMEHRTGFDLDYLSDILQQAGFGDKTTEDQQTHPYESGLRIVCRKPKKRSEKDEFFSAFRNQLYKTMTKLHDSMELLPVERFCIERMEEEWRGNADLGHMLALGAVCNPQISRILLETASAEEFSTLMEEKVSDCACGEGEGVGGREEERKGERGGERKGERKGRDEGKCKVVQQMIDLKLHHRLFTLWERARKRPGRSGEDFLKFREEKESMVRRLFDSDDRDPGSLDKTLHYIITLPPTPISFFHPQSIQHQARILQNQGIKEFSRNDLLHAKKLFIRSRNLDPDNPLAHWNLGRIGAVMRRMNMKEAGSNRSDYTTAREVAKVRGGKRVQRLIDRELKALDKIGPISVPGKPVSEFTRFES